MIKCSIYSISYKRDKWLMIENISLNCTNSVVGGVQVATPTAVFLLRIVVNNW